MSTDEPAPEASSEPVQVKPKRSPLERIVVWGAILLLGLIVAIEYVGMTGYSQALEKLETRLDEARADPEKSLLLSEVKKSVSMGGSVGEPTDVSGQTESTVSWKTALRFLPNRDYKLHLTLNGPGDDPAVLGITTASDRAEENRIRNKQP